MTGFSQDQLEARHISNIGDSNALTPGLQINKTISNSTISQLSIRGITQSNPAIYWDPAVGAYVDGVYIGKSLGSIFDVVDLERVEVLRGSQDTHKCPQYAGGRDQSGDPCAQRSTAWMCQS
ncbi:TonB-dependent receptor plug domain-containing protein [Polycyclovorans algicola]|uniref:TonB-dependent receptor plug domain-containing protein n=1 Tax=Polycyclovorans algicola TaxID=616992 RepID=UPI0004A6EA1C|nr:Plug domain-containing protein [Polycyclovorans algicola]